MRMGLAIALLLCPLACSVPAAAQSKVNIEQNFADSLTALPKEELAVAGGFYVPAYSSVAMSQGKLRVDFSVTLSVHNASETQALVVKRIAYFDTAGKQVESYLKAPVALKPLATVSIFIPTDDVRGGTGANFLVDWAAANEIAEPAVEGLDGWRRRQCALRFHQPGPSDPDGRQELRPSVRRMRAKEIGMADATPAGSKRKQRGTLP
ncbi:hypothetical protein ACVWZ6_003691 [Bradyrhizobium sp. GM6.1]